MDRIAGGPEIVCLLPVRNGGEQLSSWLEEARMFCDAVVALDDGSTDGTVDVLRSHPLVARVLENPRRDGYLGWHDGVNRNRLLAAAAELSPRWIISIDADERMDPTDAAALRRFVSTEALTACAYGIQVFRMVPGERHDPAFEWVFRLFHYSTGQRFPNRRLDFVPIPNSIPSTAWVRTTLRIKHYADPDEVSRGQRLAKYREADPEGNFGGYYEGFRPLSTGPHPSWAPRPPAQEVLLAGPLSGVVTAPGLAGTERRAPFVVCLLPARNCAPLLPTWFDSAFRFADAVVALDDGSTDGTGKLLSAHPLVRRLLTNPPRSGFEGWDDGANRARLLEAAAELAPDWVFFLDADERVPAEDGVALRRFIAEQARPGFAYGFPLYRMIDDEHHYDRLESVAWRLFAFEPGLTLAAGRLHDVPVPQEIPRHRWIATSIRIQHLGGLSELDRETRWRKYQEADPNREWEPDYEYTRIPPAGVVEWPSRDVDMPVVDWPTATQLTVDSEVAALDLEGPVLSIALLVDPESRKQMIDMVGRLGRQPCPEPFELLVVGPAAASGDLLAIGPHVRLVEVEVEASAGAARNAALRAARGDYISFFEAPSPVAPGLVTAVLEAHRQGHALLVGRPRCNGLPRPAVASVLLDVAGLPSHKDHFVLPGPVASFACDALIRMGGFDEQAASGVDELAARELLRQGFTGGDLDLLVVTPPRQPATLVALLRQRVALGRCLAHAVPITRENTNRPFGVLRAATRQYQVGRRTQTTDASGRGWQLSALLAAGSAATWVGLTRERLGRRRGTSAPGH